MLDKEFYLICNPLKIKILLYLLDIDIEPTSGIQ